MTNSLRDCQDWHKSALAEGCRRVAEQYLEIMAMDVTCSVASLSMEHRDTV
jgi:hypothetical protein